jgi:four helix bundle protein
MKTVKIIDRTLQFGIDIVRPLSDSRNWHTELKSLRSQTIRSGTSIGANIMEGQNSSSKREFLRYMQIALRSSRETEYWLQLLIGSNVLAKEQAENLLQENVQISKILTSIVLHSKS